jgi:lambda family phage tail tape measure protein
MKEKNAYEALLKYQEDSKKAQEDLNNASGKKKDAPAPVDDAVLKALSRSIELTDKYSASMTELIQKKELAMQAPFMTQAEIKLQEENIQIQKAFSDAQAGLIKLKEEGKLTDSAYTEQAQKLGQAYEQVITQTQRLYAEQEKLNSSWEYGANVALYKYAQESRNIAKITEGAVMGALNSLDDALFGIITRTTSVADAFKSMTISILSDIAKILIRQSITAPIAGALAGAIGGAFTSNVNLGSQSLGSTSTGSTGFGINPNASLSGMRAMGGSVGAGNSYLVGEMGAEVFTPNTNGYITPNNQLGGSTNVVVNVNMAEGTTSASDGNQLGIMIGNVVKAELVKQKRAGGLLA